MDVEHAGQHVVPVASMTSVPVPASRSAPSAAIFSPAMPTSPVKLPAGVTTLPPLMMRSSFMVCMSPPERSASGAFPDRRRDPPFAGSGSMQ